jgi:DNA-binding IclR family transcriptional regulator
LGARAPDKRVAILESVVHRPGMTFSGLAQALDAPKLRDPSTGDHLVYVAEVGSERLPGFLAQTDIRRPLLGTAAGKALLVARPAAEREAYLRRQAVEDPQAVDGFLAEYEQIERTRIATHLRLSGTRLAIATAVRGHSGEAAASVTLVGQTSDLEPRLERLTRQLIRHADYWSQRSTAAREAM